MRGIILPLIINPAPRRALKIHCMTDAATAQKKKRATRNKGNNITPTNAPKGAVRAEGIVCYSETDLEEFRAVVQRKLDAAKKEHAYHANLANGKDPMASSSEGYLTMDTANIGMEKDYHNQMASRQFTLIQNLEAALVRIETKRTAYAARLES